MGFLSKIFKPVKKLFKSVGKVIKKAFKEVRRFAKSTAGRTLLTMAAVYFGGQALGMWGAESAAAATVPVVEVEFLGQVAPAVTEVGAAAGVSGVTPAVVGGAGAETVAALAGGAPVSADATRSFMQKAVDAAKATGAYAKKHPYAAVAGGKFLQSIAGEDPVEAQLRLERGRQRRTNVGGVQYGDPYSGATPPLRTSIQRQQQQQELNTRTY